MSSVFRASLHKHHSHVLAGFDVAQVALPQCFNGLPREFEHSQDTMTITLPPCMAHVQSRLGDPTKRLPDALACLGQNEANVLAFRTKRAGACGPMPGATQYAPFHGRSRIYEQDNTWRFVVRGTVRALASDTGGPSGRGA